MLTTNICTVADCEEVRESRDFCSKHNRMPAGTCGNIGPRESAGPCVLKPWHSRNRHVDISGGEWLV